MPKIRIKISAVLFWALTLALCGPGRGIMWLCAAALHETGHIAAMLLCGARPERVIIRPAGAEIVCPGLRSYRADAFIALAGPAANLISWGVYRLLSGCPPDLSASGGMGSAFALSSLALAAVNLLPVNALDGGNAVASLLSSRFSAESAETALRVLSALTLIPLWTVSVYILFYFPREANPSLLLLCMALFAGAFLGSRE